MLCLPIHGAPRNVRYGSEADVNEPVEIGR